MAMLAMERHCSLLMVDRWEACKYGRCTGKDSRSVAEELAVKLGEELEEAAAAIDGKAAGPVAVVFET